MSKQTPTSFESTRTALERLFDPAQASTRASEPAGNAAVIFSAIIQARAIDRLTKQIERCADAMTGNKPANNSGGRS